MQECKSLGHLGQNKGHRFRFGIMWLNQDVEATNLHEASSYQCWISIVLFILFHLGIVLRISPFLVPVWYEYLIVFGFLIPSVGSIYHARTFVYLGKNTIVSNCYMMVLTQLITRVHTKSLILTYPPNINILHILQFWYPWVGSSIPYLILITDTHAFTYIPVQPWCSNPPMIGVGK